ncbi:MAG: hypothetical protein H6669_16740 [Ardenticatenaceae bacterium]|nr:hypothetical protein [Ardenticatenaceae bacterium]
MTQEPEILKIEIPVEEETPFVPESARPDVKAKMAAAGKTAVSTATQTTKKVWNSGPRRKVTRGISRGAAQAASKTGKFVSEKVAKAAERQAREQVTAVQTRLQETDWKAQAKSGTARGLHWISDRLARLAAKINTPHPK